VATAGVIDDAAVPFLYRCRWLVRVVNDDDAVGADVGVASMCVSVVGIIAANDAADVVIDVGVVVGILVETSVETSVGATVVVVVCASLWSRCHVGILGATNVANWTPFQNSAGEGVMAGRSE
jgi:hypothetical protein